MKNEQLLASNRIFRVLTTPEIWCHTSAIRHLLRNSARKPVGCKARHGARYGFIRAHPRNPRLNWFFWPRITRIDAAKTTARKSLRVPRRVTTTGDTPVPTPSRAPCCLSQRRQARQEILRFCSKGLAARPIDTVPLEERDAIALLHLCFSLRSWRAWREKL